MTDFTDTICAVSTAPGNGAIAVIRVAGNKTFPIIEKIFKPVRKNLSVSEQATHTAYFGTISDENYIIDEVLVTIFKSPNSFTGEDIVEIGCHGSLYIQQQILQTLIKKGCRIAQPGEFTQRAYMNGKLDLAQAEAVADLIASTGQASHRVAMNQMRGGISNELKQLRQQLLHFISLIELELDFSEEEVEFADRKQLNVLLNQISEVVNRLIKSFNLGNAIKNGIPVAIVGEPNVGKSTLLNAILKEEKAIVSEIAGTTRDAIEDTFNLDGLTYRFIDTAGIRHTNDTIENLGIERTFQKISQAAVVFAMFDIQDSSEKIKTSINSLKSHLQDDTVLIIVRNKADKQQMVPEKINHPNVYADVLISAKNGKVDDLLNVLTAMMRNRESEAHDVIVTNARHYNALVLANEALERAGQGLNNNMQTDFLAMDIRDVIQHLAGITGEEITTDEVLGNIFKNFCIGK